MSNFHCVLWLHIQSLVISSYLLSSMLLILLEVSVKVTQWSLMQPKSYHKHISSESYSSVIMHVIHHH